MSFLSKILGTHNNKAEVELRQFRQMLDQMPVNVMTCDSIDFKINYMNKTSCDTLRQIERLLPVKVDEILGQSIDIFHKSPAGPRAILGNPKNLPHIARIQLGDEYLSLRASAIFDTNGAYIGVLQTWSVITRSVLMTQDFESNIKGIVDMVSSSATQLQATAESLSTSATQLTSAITEISKQVNESSRVTSEGANKAQESNDTMHALSKLVEQIGAIVSMIRNVAEQTNLLALNATIEAARAGEAGKGFTVVANEVKGLANQTSKATDDISHQINGIQQETHVVASHTSGVCDIMTKINSITTSIAAAIEQQSAASNETGRAASDVLSAARDLSKQSEYLRSGVDNFLIELRKF